MSTVKKVAVFGGGKGIEPGSWAYQQAFAAGQLLAQRDIAVWTGAGHGVMEAVAKGANSRGGRAYGVQMWDRNCPNETDYEEVLHASFFLPKVQSMATRNEHEFGVRLGWLLEADAFIAIGEDRTPGTLIEILSVINLNRKLWNPCKKMGVAMHLAYNAELYALEKKMMNPEFERHCLSAESAVEFVLAP